MKAILISIAIIFFLSCRKEDNSPFIKMRFDVTGTMSPDSLYMDQILPKSTVQRIAQYSPPLPYSYEYPFFILGDRINFFTKSKLGIGKTYTISISKNQNGEWLKISECTRGLMSPQECYLYTEVK